MDRTSPSKYTIPSDVVGEELDGEMILLNMETGIYFGLNSVGTQLWHELEVHGDLQLAVRELCERYSSVPEATIRKDATALVAQLASKGLLGCAADREAIL